MKAFFKRAAEVAVVAGYLGGSAAVAVNVIEGVGAAGQARAFLGESYSYYHPFRVGPSLYDKIIYPGRSAGQAAVITYRAITNG